MTSSTVAVDTNVNENQYKIINDTPWEEISIHVPTGMRALDIIKRTQLDWSVSKVQAHVKFNEQYIPVVGNYVLLRSTDGKILSPYMGNRYKPIQNLEAFDIFEMFAMAGNLSIEVAGSLRDGKHIWCLASMEDKISIGNGESISGYFLLMQSHVYGFALRAMFMPVRFPSALTIVRPLPKIKGVDRTGTYRIPHSCKFNNSWIGEVKRVVDVARKQFMIYTDWVSKMSNMELTDQEGIKFLSSIFDPGSLKKWNKYNNYPTNYLELCNDEGSNRLIKRSYSLSKGTQVCTSSAKTLLRYYNTVLYAFDHEFGHNVHSRLESSWMGKNSIAKNKAYELATSKVTNKLSIE